jgi:formamidopyrimidine-DNA glycosylase
VREATLPELPEVETVARYLRETVVGETISAVVIADSRFADLEEAHELVGRRVVRVGRRGKYLSLELDDDWVLQLHMMMAGQILVRPKGHAEDRFLRLHFDLSGDIEVRFCDSRRFGRAHQLEAGAYREFLKSLGPEPLANSFTTRRLLEALASRKVALKSALLNQQLIAGVGNIYADEASWRARLHPLTPAGSLSDAEAGRLHRGIRQVLRDGIASRGTTFSQYRSAEGEKGEYQSQLRVFQRTGEKCFRCPGTIQRIVVGGRSTHFCPRCQPVSRVDGS